jgi:hypothetical protein
MCGGLECRSFDQSLLDLLHEMSSFPPPSAPSAIFLFILYAISLSSSLLVIVTLLFFYGINTISSKLTFYLNLSVTLWTFTKLPYLLVEIPHGCQVSGIFHWYCTFQMLIITFTIVDALNIKMLLSSPAELEQGNPDDQRPNLNPSSSSSSSEMYQLQYSKIFAIFFLPIFPVIYPTVTDAFGSVFEWCGLDRTNGPGQSSRVIFLLALFFLQFGVILKFIFLCLNLRRLPKESYDDVFGKLLRGPGAYAATLVTFTFLEDLITLWQYSSQDLSNEVRYTLEYVVVVLEGLFGITLALIFFFLEGKDIQVCCHALLLSPPHPPPPPSVIRGPLQGSGRV